MKHWCHVSLALAAVSTAAALPKYSDGDIKFQDCPASLNPNSTSGMTCGYLDVALDWDNPHAHDPYTIGFIKLAARHPENRIGTMFYNPGGPGELASTLLSRAFFQLGDKIHPEVRDRFDIIGMDLRGTGLSERLHCNTTLYNIRFPFYSTTEEQFQALIDRNRAFRQSCLDMTGRPLIDYMDTKSIAKDYEAIRQALGGPKITFNGASYGTLLGSQYAELFPEAFRALLLDGPFSNSQSETAQFVWEAAATEAALKKVFEGCAEQNATTCPIAYMNKTVEAVWMDLTDRAEKEPIPAPGCISGKFDCLYDNVTASQIREWTQQWLFMPGTTLPTLISAIYNATVHNDATFFGVNPIAKADYWNSYDWLQASTAITCQDVQHVSSPSDQLWRKMIAASETPLMMGGNVGNILLLRNCIGWPEPKRNPPHKIDIPRVPGFPPILIVSNLWDPSTPNAFAVNLVEEIGTGRATLLTRKAVGHTVFFQSDAYGGETWEAVNKYLLTVEVPEQGTVYQT